MGDAVYEILVREYVVSKGNRKANDLHQDAIKFVKAAAQSQAAELVMPMLGEDEAAVFNRGRNSNATGVPKSASTMDYRRATGLEAVFGYLYLNGKNERIKQIFDYIAENLVMD